jgi:murein L,D-transpeptidase YafK
MLPANIQIDRVVVEKSARRLSVYSHGQLLKSYSVALGRQPLGTKSREGDNRTPEGVYRIDAHNPASSFHRALHLSYPSAADTARARAAGQDPGGDIMIHGIRNGLGWLGRVHRTMDWTRGCIAVTNPEIEELFRAVPDGTPVEIRP